LFVTTATKAGFQLQVVVRGIKMIVIEIPLKAKKKMMKMIMKIVI